MAVLIAGGAGFIGSNLCSKLLKKGKKVVVVDDLSTGRLSNIKEFYDDKNFTFIKGDICSNATLKKIRNYTFDEIYHLASPANVDFVTQNPIKSAMANSIGSYNLLTFAVKNKSAFLFASSSEVYGDPKISTQDENYWGNVNPTGVRSGYDEGKRFGEALCSAFRKEYNLHVSIVRIFNTYGPKSTIEDSRAIPQLVSMAIKNKPLIIYGDGKQTRSFCYVDDMVKGMIEVMKKKIPGPINLGTSDEISIYQLSQTIIKLTNSKSKIEFSKKRPDDPLIRKPDLKLAKKLINWKPKYSLEKGLTKTIKYFNQYEE